MRLFWVTLKRELLAGSARGADTLKWSRKKRSIFTSDFRVPIRTAENSGRMNSFEDLFGHASDDSWPGQLARAGIAPNPAPQDSFRITERNILFQSAHVRTPHIRPALGGQGDAPVTRLPKPGYLGSCRG